MRITWAEGLEHKLGKLVFIGGMDGVVVEAHMIRDMYPDARFLPIFSTGGAVKAIYEEFKIGDERLKENYSFYELFKEVL